MHAWRGVRDATRYGPSCYQSMPEPWGPYSADFLPSGAMSEDCLSLNIWKPAAQKAPLPVFVFIHGGAFQGGSGAVAQYEGRNLAARGAVVVTINYRVGVLGFLAHPELTAESSRHSSGNYGLLDQIAALQWIRRNIAKFGGDPRNVTVAGESAGAASVNDLIVSPPARGLFRRAMSISGASMSISAPTLRKGEADGLEFGRKVGAPTLAALRAAPVEKLVAAAKLVPSEGGAPSFVFVPHIDSTVLPVNANDGSAPIASNVPLLTGYNAAEMIDMSIRKPEDFARAVRGRYGTFAARLLALYPHATDEEAAASNALLARDRYMTGLVLWAQARTRASGQTIYAYLHDHAFPPVRGGVAWGAFHSSSLPYIFGTFRKSNRDFTPADDALSQQWQDRVLAFMRSSDPSLPDSHWPRLLGADDVMRIGDSTGLIPAASSPARFEVLRAYAEAGGAVGLL